MELHWKDDFSIRVRIEQDSSVVISANEDGLRSLASQLLSLAEGEAGDHIHYDEWNSLEEGSAELIVEKVT